MTTTRLRLAGFMAVLGVSLSGAPAPAQVAPPAPPPDSFSAHVQLAAMVFDNFFDATDGSPTESVKAAMLGGGLAFRLSEASPYEIRLAGDYTTYEGFDPSSSFTGGLRFQRRPHGWALAAQYVHGRPGREVGDVFDRANVLGFSGEYSYRITKDFEVFGRGQFRRETYELFPGRATDGYAIGGALRYRGLGRQLSPEVGVNVGSRSVSEPGEDLSQFESYLTLRSTPTPSLYVSTRYRRRSRDYTVADASARNFGREDTRQQFMVAADWTRGSLVWNLYYTLDDSNSSHLSGNFTTQALSLGLTVRF